MSTKKKLPAHAMGSGNIFADLGLPTAEEHQLKAALVVSIKTAHGGDDPDRGREAGGYEAAGPVQTAPGPIQAGFGGKAAADADSVRSGRRNNGKAGSVGKPDVSRSFRLKRLREGL